VILLDTSGLFAALNPDQRGHEPARDALQREQHAGVISPFILAELGYLLAARGGVSAELRLLGEVAGGVYSLAPFDADDIGAARDLVERYRDLGIGLADASILVLADKLGAERVLTLDERHFRAVRTSSGPRLTILPADG
jgi:predicted nucleic acid-binding protein